MASGPPAVAADEEAWVLLDPTNRPDHWEAATVVSRAAAAAADGGGGRGKGKGKGKTASAREKRAEGVPEPDIALDRAIRSGGFALRVGGGVTVVTVSGSLAFVGRRPPPEPGRRRRPRGQLRP